MRHQLESLFSLVSNWQRCILRLSHAIICHVRHACWSILHKEITRSISYSRQHVHYVHRHREASCKATAKGEKISYFFTLHGYMMWIHVKFLLSGFDDETFIAMTTFVIALFSFTFFLLIFLLLLPLLPLLLVVRNPIRFARSACYS